MLGNVVIFGGSGFIGTHFAKYLIEQKKAAKVFLFDREDLRDKGIKFRETMLAGFPQIEFIQGNVENSIQWIPKESIDLIANFAAVHREPGHEDNEYYRCNLLGAENVCDWAQRIRCNKIIFSSSISPYGPSEAIKDENSLPVPVSAYGGSKLAAEKIHQIWQAKGKQHKLIIIRPGVVFGPGEGGNVSRLIKAVKGRYFVYMGNKKTRKAGVYVKELCHALIWVLDNFKTNPSGVILFNMSMNPGPSIEEYVEAIIKISMVKTYIPTLPKSIIYTVSHLIEVLAKPLGISHPFSPIRVRKLVRSNNIHPKFLVDQGYLFKYSLNEAFQDWEKDCPEDW